MKARIAFAVALSTAFVVEAAAAPLAELLPNASAEERARLVSGEQLLLDAKTHGGLRLLPLGREGEGISRAASARASEILMESAFLVKGARLSGPARLAAYNALGAVRTLSGVTYFSETRQKVTVLFDEVYRVAAPGSREALPDVRVSVVPEKTIFDLHIKDANFGSTWYSLSVEAGGAGLSLYLTNTRPLGLFLVRAFETEGLRLHFALVEAEEGVLVYGLCAADPHRAALSLVDMWSAMEKRLSALRSWIVGRIGR